jgi:hypothetical protein
MDWSSRQVSLLKGALCTLAYRLRFVWQLICFLTTLPCDLMRSSRVFNEANTPTVGARGDKVVEVIDGVMRSNG